MTAEQAKAEKANSRERFAAYRAGLSEEERTRRSEQVAARLWDLPEIQSVRAAAAAAVLCYWPGHGEIDVRPLVERLRANGATVALPVVTSFEKGAPAMEARRYDGPGCLRENRWGLAEPSGTARVAPETLGAVVVPAFGAGRAEGHRIGHGRGFYDAFLTRVRGDAPASNALPQNPRSAAAVCPVYDACLAARVPAEAHDVPMDVLVTERETLRP